MIRTGDRFILAGALAALILGSTSCGGGADPGAGRPQVDAAAAKRQREALEKDVDTIAKALVKSPYDYKSTIGNCEKYGAQAKEHGLKDLVARLEKIKADAKGAYEAAAEKELKDASEKVRSYLAAGDMEKAKNRAKGIPKILSSDEKYLSRVDDISTDIRRAERADRYFEKVTRTKVEDLKKRSEFERAKGVCEAFLAIPAFSTSAKKKDVEAMIASLAPDIEKAKAAKGAESALKPLPAFNGNDSDLEKIWDFSDPGTLKITDKILAFTHNSDDEMLVRNGVAMRCGAEDWEDYNVEITFKNLEGDAYVNAHGVLEGDEDSKGWKFKSGVQLTAAEFKEKDRWYRLKIEVRGKELIWTPIGSSVPATKKLPSDKGPFEIRLPKKGNGMQIKTIWVKVLKPVGAKLPG